MSSNGGDTRRSLFVDFCELIPLIRPDAVFMENVPDLFSKRHWPYYVRGRDLLESSGYIVRGRIYNFAGFGLPQERFRAVVMAVPHPFEMPEPHLEPSSFRTVRQAIAHLPRLQAGERWPEDPMHIVSKHRPATVALLSQVPLDGGNRPVGVGPRCLDRTRQEHGGYTDVYGRLAWDRPAVTITARCRTPSCGRFAHPEQTRGLSVREAALLQGFPEHYIFEGPFDDKYKQIGNAVPPSVAKFFAEHLLRVIRRGPVDAREETSSADVSGPVGPGFAVTINGLKRRRIRCADRGLVG
jgi:DNA (cytosine-5)-methyltransferase 1